MLKLNRVPGFGALVLAAFAGVLNAQTPPAGGVSPVVTKPTYITMEFDVTVNRPAAEVWKRIGKFCDVGEWFRIPCTIISGKDCELGAVRSAANEILVAQTEFSYTYTQAVRADRPYNLYHGTVEARPIAPSTTKVIYTLIYDNSMLADDAAREAERAQRTARFKTVMENIKIVAEGGTLPPVPPRAGKQK
jgi:hypothetical protein